MKARGYAQFDFPLDGKRGYLVDDKYPPERTGWMNPYEGSLRGRDDFYYLTERGRTLGDYYRTKDIADPEDKGRWLYKIEPCTSDGCRCGWDSFVVEYKEVRHGRYRIAGFNRVELPDADESE